MKSTDIESLESHVVTHSGGCHVCGTIKVLRRHVLELQAFITALTDHYAAPGPTPEKTAEHYRLAARAKDLRAKFEAMPIHNPAVFTSRLRNQ